MPNYENKGKDKELEVTATLLLLAIGNNDVDIIRPSTTNTADCGTDLILKQTNSHLNEMIEIANGKREDFSNQQDTSKKITTRIDVKAYKNRKIPKNVAEKFVGDMKLNPDCDAHVLMGGDGLTKGAQQIIDNAKAQLPEYKRIETISNDGVQRLANLALGKASCRLNSLSSTEEDSFKD